MLILVLSSGPILHFIFICLFRLAVVLTGSSRSGTNHTKCGGLLGLSKLTMLLLRVLCFGCKHLLG